MTDLTSGAHTVNYSVEANYYVPGDQVVTIIPNQLAAVQGVYTVHDNTNMSCEFISPVCADYDGDHKADPALVIVAYSIGIYNVLLLPWSSTWNYYCMARRIGWFPPLFEFNPADYSAVGADFDGDNYADVGFYKASSGAWSAILSSDMYLWHDMTGLLGNIYCTALAADFDGDAKADPAVYNPVTADWQINLSSNNYQTLTLANWLGGPGWSAAAGDMDGDKKADPYVCNMKTGQCIARLSTLNYAFFATPEGSLGTPGWNLALGDYDGDGLTDPAVYNPMDITLNMKLSGNYYQLSTFDFLSTNNVTASPIQ